MKSVLNITVLDSDKRTTTKAVDLSAPSIPPTHLISCLMVSRGEIFPAAFAIECFQKQSYPNKELVIVSANSNGALKAYVDELGDHRIRFFQVPDWTLGTLRNLSIGLARGDLMATWDDDDLRHPLSLEIQYAALMATNAAMLCLLRLILWQPARKRVAVTQARRWENSILAWKYKMPEYPSLPKREDTHMMQQISKQHSIALIDRPELYVYTVHGKNTWQESHFDSFFSKATVRYDDAGYDRTLDQLSSMVPVTRYADLLLEGFAS